MTQLDSTAPSAPRLPTGWLRTTDRATGRQLAVAVPSESTPNTWHLVRRDGCTCRGFWYRNSCRHWLALAEALGEDLSRYRFFQS